MSMEIPSDLIRRIQTTLRSNAGIPASYDPTGSSIPALPSIHDAISALDDGADPFPLLRCSSCRRGSGLLRGALSTLCIFCGHDRRKDGLTHTVSFDSTASCKKLLQSLQLDGSEVINLDTESNDLYKGQDTQQQDGLVLSSVLNLELKWPPEQEEAVNKSSEKTPASVQAVNLSGVNLDTFFSNSKDDADYSAAHSVISEESMRKKQILNTESHVSSGSENFGFFKDLKAPDMAVSSNNTTGGNEFAADSFADWEADFQSAAGLEAFTVASEPFEVINRMNGLNEKIGMDFISTGAADTSENETHVPILESSNSKVEMLLSQMPDLSFMLDDHLNIPNKASNPNLKS